MAQLRTSAILLSVKGHGEHGAVVRLLTPDAGLVPAYVRGGRSRRLRPMLQPGNRLAVELRARTETQLAGATVEMEHSVAAIHAEPVAADALAWATGLTATVLPEQLAQRSVHDALEGLIAAIEAGGAARAWSGGLARYELLLLTALGFGLDLEQCAATGRRDDLGWVSPRTGGAVGRQAAAGHEARLLRLPPFLVAGGPPQSLADALDALAVTGHFIDRMLLEGRARIILDARARLMARLAGAA